MRILLAGQRSFGRAVYDMIVEQEKHEIVEVWSPDDLPEGRPFAEWSDKLTQKAAETGEWAPKLMRTPERVAEMNVDLIVCAHSHDFISRPVREATKFGAIGYHPSLLPRHRGRDAVRWAVHMDDPITGGSVYWLTDNVDAGPIAAQEHVFIPPLNDVVFDKKELTSWLWRTQLFPLGLELIDRVLDDISNSIIVEIPQDEDVATWEPSWERPPLHKPDLKQIGSGIPGMRHITSWAGGDTWKTVRRLREEARAMGASAKADRG